MILVTGGSGQLAKCLKLVIPNAVFLDSKSLDITNNDQVKKVLAELHPRVVINCAAYTKVDLSEKEITLAEKVNTIGPGNLAKATALNDCGLIHISTDYVFNGASNTPYKESHSTSPESVYGQTKRNGELLVQKYANRYAIIRTSWLYSEYNQNFVKTILKLLSERQSLKVVSDQIGSPTYAFDLASVIAQLANTETPLPNEIFHYSNQGVASWYDFAMEIKLITHSSCQVDPIETSEYPTPAKRPKYSVFCTNKIKTYYNLDIPYWKESLKKCLMKL